jgi:hypothetical protein
MTKALSDPAQILMLAFQDFASAIRALQDLRELRSQKKLHADSMALLRMEVGGEGSCNVEMADLNSPEGALIAALGDMLIGAVSNCAVDTVAREPVGVPGKRSAVKRIDRGICSARLKPLRSCLLPGSFAIVALLRESEMAQLARALTKSRAVVDARAVWVDLELDLDVLIADVLGPSAIFTETPPAKAGGYWFAPATSTDVAALLRSGADA